MVGCEMVDKALGRWRWAASSWDSGSDWRRSDWGFVLMEGRDGGG